MTMNTNKVKKVDITEGTKVVLNHDTSAEIYILLGNIISISCQSQPKKRKCLYFTVTYYHNYRLMHPTRIIKALRGKIDRKVFEHEAKM